MRAASQIDPVTLTVRWARLRSIVDEASATLLRTAFSHTVTESWDYTCALFDARGEMVAQGSHGLPSFLGSLALAVKDFLREYPPDRLEPGDSLCTTDPWIGASQINDLFFVTPIFHCDRIVAYAANVSHMPDVGGRLLSADSTEIFEEGFRLPIMKMFRRGLPNDDLFRIIRLNVRVPDIVVGDLLAQHAANSVMTRGLLALLETEGLDDIQDLANEILERSEAAMRRALSVIPAGTYSGSVRTDGFDHPLTLRCSIEARGDEVLVDFTGTSPQVEQAINVAWRYAYAELVHAMICVAAPRSPVNGAMLRPIRAHAPEGTVLSALPPAALASRAMVCMFVQALVFRTLAPAVPDRIIADAGSPPAIPAYMGRSHGGRPFVEIFRVNGGFGARPKTDGISALGWPAPVSGTQVETIENEIPILFLRKELVDDSGGAGRTRGGLGHHFVWRSYSRAPIVMGMRLDRITHPPLGLFGGRPGAPASVRINARPVHPKRTTILRDGDVLEIRSAGSGGYGEPRRRDPQLVHEDVRDGYVSSTSAERDYGVRVGSG